MFRLLVLLIALSSPVHAYITRPEIHGEAFVAAFNAATPEAARNFAENHAAAGPEAADRFLELFQREHAMQGLLERPSYRVLPGGRVLFVTARRTGTGAWQNFQFRIDASNDNRLQLIFVSLAMEPVSLPDTNLSDPQTAGWLDSVIGHLAESQPFYGVIAIRQGDEIIYRQSAGPANAEAGIVNSRQTRFNTASASKMFTAMAIMQLVESGQLDMNDSIARWIGELSDNAQAEAITVRHLLTHTSGIPDYWDDAYEAEWDRITNHDALLAHVIRNFGSPEPGGFAYSNANYALLGSIVERVTGEDFYTYVDEHVFQPAGMVHAGYPLREEASWPEDMARPYGAVINAGQLVIGEHSIAALGVRGSSAGGAYVSIEDMLAFDAAIREGTLLRPETLAAMRCMQAPSAGLPEYGYGYGFLIEQFDGIRSAGHGGSGPGTQSAYRRYDDADISYVILSNYDTIAVNELSGLLDRLIRRELADTTPAASSD